jgi:hypothetical protein
MHVRHVSNGGPGRRAMYFATVVREDHDAELRQFTVNTRGTPQNILSAHLPDERTRLRGDGRASWSFPLIWPPQMMPYSLSTPAVYRGRFPERSKTPSW